MIRLRLPKYIHHFNDRHGKARYYLRVPGQSRVPLPGLPYSPEFMAAYSAAINGADISAKMSKRSPQPGTVNALIVSFYGSLSYATLAPQTKTTYRAILERFREEHGDKRVALLQRSHVIQLLAGKKDTPAAANTLLKVLRKLMCHAIEAQFRRDDPTVQVRPVRIRTNGYHTWTDEEIAKFESAHPIGSKARLAFALLLHTAQRRGDVIGLGPQHLRNGTLHIQQRKTPARVFIPVSSELQEILDATKNDQLNFLVTEYGRPFSAAGFGNRFREWCDEAGLPKCCSAHGLRKAAARRLAECGCSAHEIMSITGHTTLKEVARYTKDADARRLAIEAMRKTATRTSSGKLE